jgi:hypothetical protein
MHVHVERDDRIAKIWLQPPRLQSSGGFGRSEISKVLDTVKEKQKLLQEGWCDYFGNQ